MNVIYLFCESNEIRIPFWSFDKVIIRQLTELGGIWKDDYYGFIFKQKINLYQLKSIFKIVYLITYNLKNINSSGFNKYILMEQLCKRNENEKNLTLRTDSSEPYQSVCTYKKHTILEKMPEQYLNKLIFELRSGKYSLKTQKAYIYYIRLLCSTMKKNPSEIYPDDVTEFLAIMEKEHKFSASSINLAISAIKFFFRYVLKDNRIKEQKRPNQNKILPMVLSANEINSIFSMEKNQKHRLLLMLVYSSGLRVSEVVSLKKEHIDLSRQVIYIRQGKGRKDRYTMLSEKAALFIQEYYKEYEIDKWIFPGQTGVSHLTIRSAQRIFEKASRNAGITKNISIHGLRHTFATHLLENGIDIRYIKDLLGHANIRTTERYTHVAKRNVLNIKSPLDSI